MPDYFQTLGVPRHFSFENAAIERRFHDLQRSSHPDKFAGSSDAIANSAMDRSSEINRAYKTLRDPLARTKHLLSLYGYSVEQSKQVPMELLEVVMNVQEKVAELEHASEEARVALHGSIEPILTDLSSRRDNLDAHTKELQQQWDANEHREPENELSTEEKDILSRIAQDLAQRSYITTLLGSLEAASRGESHVLKH